MSILIDRNIEVQSWHICTGSRLAHLDQLFEKNTWWNIKVATFGSTIGGESPKETLHSIAQGQFGGRVNGTSSGGGTYSPPLNDDFNPFDK
jgi:hypothetical protein